jgi:hypothetical protein
VYKAKPVMLAAACHIQEMLTATDPENAVAELDVDDTPPAVQPAVPLTDEQCDKVVNEVVESEAKKRGLHVDNLNTDVTTQHYLRRAIVRAAHGITAAPEKGNKQ